MKANEDTNDRTFSIGSKDDDVFNVAFGKPNSELWKASADDEKKSPAEAKADELNWTLGFSAWWYDGAEDIFEGQAESIEWTNDN